MPNKYIMLGILVLLTGAVAAGYYLGKGQKEVTVEEKIIYKKGEERIQYRDRTIIKERIVAPDGTITERETTKDIAQEIERRSTELAQEMVSKSKPVLSNYSLGLKYWLPLSDKIVNAESYGTEQLEITAGRRLLGEIWLDAGYKLDNSFSVGLSLRF